MDGLKFDKWTELKFWLTDHHYGVIKRQRIAIKNGSHIHIKDDDDILNVLDKMLELEREEINHDRDEKLKRVTKPFVGAVRD